MPEWIIALISVVLGAGISEFRHWRENRERFRVMTFEKRLHTHQEALSQIYRIWHDTYDNKLNFDDKNVSIKKAIMWWEDNQLLLDYASRRQMQDLFSAAYHHLDGTDKPSVFDKTWRKTRETIYKGIGSKHLLDTIFNEESEADIKSKLS
ncbi:MAG: hypothetical protein HYX91_03965 [Chloroflexi bacterium]|nr:hypothetical protein [Chloroflexota bacterium]